MWYSVQTNLSLMSTPNFAALLAMTALRALATWRVTHLFMYEAGPYDVVLKLRERFGVLHDSDSGQPIAYPDGSVFACFLCFSIWVGAVASVLPRALALPLALSALAIWAEKSYKGHVYGKS